MTTKVTATGASSPFSSTLTGLFANSTYYYKAYVVEDGQEVFGSQQSFKTKAVSTASVSTVTANPVGSNSATLKGSFSGATGTIHEAGIVWSTNASLLNDPDSNSATLNWAYDTDCVGSYASGNISCTVTGLTPETTYYYRAFVAEYNEETGDYDYRYGSRISVTTAAAQTTTDTDYLSDYGIPDLTGLNPTLRDHADSRTGWDDYWYSYSTGNSQRQLAVHTYVHPDTKEETFNYAVLYDGSRYAPVWTCHTMNETVCPDKGVTRPSSDPWTSDPAISLVQFDGLNDNSTYSRGHFVASNYRKSTTGQNKQTFYYTNKAPQYQNGFNSGVWSTLEERVVTMTPSGTTMMYVVTGVLYEGTLTYKPKTVNGTTYNVPLPSHFYKCIMMCTFNGSGEVTGAQGIAFVFTNVSHTGEQYYAGATSIDAIETRAGFDFFANVPASYQNDAETNTNHSWFTGVTTQSNAASPVGYRNR